MKSADITMATFSDFGARTFGKNLPSPFSGLYFNQPISHFVAEALNSVRWVAVCLADEADTWSNRRALTSLIDEVARLIAEAKIAKPVKAVLGASNS